MAKEKFVTPSGGIAKYPYLNVPDTKYKEEGTYSVQLVLPADAETTTALIEHINTMTEEWY